MWFQGIERVYGEQARVLREAHVLVVGLGGVGSWAVEALARSGVGALTLVDPDDVCVSNINRQIQALHHTVGRGKIEALQERIKAINPDCRITAIRTFVNERTMDSLWTDACDYVIDAIDGVMPKAGLIAACHARGIPVITCGGSGGKCDPSQIRVVDLADTYHDRLLAFVRKKLRHVFKFPATGPFGVPCVFSPEPARAVNGCAAAEAGEDDWTADAGSRLNCDGRLGALTFVTGSFGFHAAAHVVNALTQTAE